MTGELDWYAGYGARHGKDGAEGRLVSMYSFTENWNVWEMHPNGTEVVLCTAGEITLIQEMAEGLQRRSTLSSGEYAVNAPGVWHTADIEVSATVVFITAGEGTEHRER
tara:strand:+ start:160 stop:486 length:327 start_codon:yes stop_codon:yes gene_type:complete